MKLADLIKEFPKLQDRLLANGWINFEIEVFEELGKHTLGVSEYRTAGGDSVVSIFREGRKAWISKNKNEVEYEVSKHIRQRGHGGPITGDEDPA